MKLRNINLSCKVTRSGKIKKYESPSTKIVREINLKLVDRIRVEKQGKYLKV
jgi:hypothetical protein